MKVEFKRTVVEVDVPVSATVAELKKVLQSKARLNVHRQGLKIKQKEGDDPKKVVRLGNGSKTLADYGVTASTVLQLSDLGPQIGYRTVFIVEYLGPILILLAYYARPAALYGAGASKAAWNDVAWMGVVAWVAHFLKREFETLFVHKFSRPTMPLSNLFKNSIYYWGFALAVGFPLCHPQYTPPANPQQVLLGAGLMAAAELVNLAVHVQLSWMRPAEGSDKRDAPGGPLFALVSCPNYTAEILSWVGFSIMTQVGVAYAFTLVGFLQMSQWALQKHVGYLKSDDKYRKLGRKAIVPFLL